MTDNSVNYSDKIMIRKPDGSFEMVEVEKDKPPRPSASVQPSRQSKTNLSDEFIKTKDFYKKDKLSKPPPPAKIQSQPAVGQDVNADNLPAFSWDSAVAEVVKNLPESIQKILKAKDQDFLQRLKKIILSRLKDVRNWLATKEALTKDSESTGGVGLDESQAAVVLNVIEASYKKIHSQPINKVTEVPSPFGADVTDLYRPKESLAALVEADLPIGQTGNYQDLLSKHISTKDQTQADNIQSKPKQPKLKAEKLPPPAPSAKSDWRKNQTAISDVSEAKPKFIKKPEPEPTKTASFQAYRPSPAVSRRPSLEDVRSPKRLMGPVEELSNMHLLDFRRLGSDTDDRLHKVLDKIVGLAEESFQKKVEGIRAWRKSPLYRKYLSIGSDSLSKNKSAKEVIEQNQQSGADELTWEEFNKITDFNKQLRY